VLDVMLEPHLLSSLHQVADANSRTIVRVMEQQISEFSTLLNQVLRGKQSRLALELPRWYSNQFAQDKPGVIKAQRLIQGHVKVPQL
jgi:hypothetical protein